MLLGFNPTDAVTTVRLEGPAAMMSDVVAAMLALGPCCAGNVTEPFPAATTAWGAPKAVILNPVVGPEPITGSTRA